MPIERYVTPAEFDELAAYARDIGLPHIESGPLVRSSYHADGQAEMVRALRKRQTDRG